MGKLLTALLLLVPTSALGANITCYDIDAVRETLTEKIGAKVQGYGIDINGGLVTLFKAPNGTFMISVTPIEYSDKICPIIEGTNWTNVLTTLFNNATIGKRN